MSSTKNKIVNVVLLLFCLVVMLVLGEVALRLIAPGMYYVWPPGMKLIRNIQTDARPGVERGESVFSINELGFRGDSPAREHTYRILTVGGSTTICRSLDDRQTWPYLLQEMLNDAAGGRHRVWVGNAGKCGDDMRNHIVQVKRLLPQFPRIDTVVILVGVNDYQLLMTRDETFRPFPGLDKLTPREYEHLMNHSFAFWPGADSAYPFLKRTEIWRRLRQAKNRLLNPPDPIMFEDVTGETLEMRRAQRRNAPKIAELQDLSPGLEDYSNNINRVIDLAESRAVRVVFLTQPFLWSSDLTEDEENILWFGFKTDRSEYYSSEVLARGMRKYNETLIEVCGTRNVEYLDLAERLNQDRSNFYDDVHFNTQGARNAASVIAEYFINSGRPPF